MTSPADRMLRDNVAALLFVQRRDGAHASDDIGLAISCMRDADAFMTGRDEYHKLMAAKPAAAQGGGDDDLAG